MAKHILCMLVFLFQGIMPLVAQYISRSEPMPYVCPTVCQGGTTVLRIFQIQSIPIGQRIQALLSNASGSFASGTQVLEADRYSTNGGSTWQNGPYVVSGNVSELLIEITIPLPTPPGNAYKVKIRTSGTYVSNEVYQCPGTGITVTPSVPALPSLPQTEAGEGQWIGHVYSWTPTFPGILNTPALVNSQDFFNPTSYKGHVLYNDLSFDIDLSGNGGIPGSWHQGTSITCGTTFSQNYSMRMLRRENFEEGLYRFEIQGDDGIRLSIDGGNTWLLSSFLEQKFADSYQTSDAVYPSGICLSGWKDLLIEYFQRPADARIKLTVTRLPTPTPNFTQPSDQTVCAGSQAVFNLGPAQAGIQYSWFESRDGGVSYQAMTDGAYANGCNSPELKINPVTQALHNYRYRCTLSTGCAMPVESNPVLLQVKPDAQILSHPASLSICIGAPVEFEVQTSEANVFQWQIDSGSGFSDLSDGGVYSGTNSKILQISNASLSLDGARFRCRISGACQGDIYSNPASLMLQPGPSIAAQPDDFKGCANTDAILEVQVSGTSSGLQWQMSLDNGLTYTNVPVTAPYSGQSTSMLRIHPSGAAPGNALFRCRISGSCGEVFSQAASLQVNALPVITAHPIDQPYCEGAQIAFSISASGTVDSYQWQLSLDAGDTYTNLGAAAPYTGSHTATLIINPALAAMTGNAYRCVATGCNEKAFSNKAFIKMSSTAVLTLQPLDASFCEGENGAVSVGAEGAESYQWQRLTNSGYENLIDNSQYSGTLESTLQFTGTEDGTYRCLISGGCTVNLPSDPVMVEVIPRLQLISGPNDTRVCNTQDASFSIESRGAQMAYQWEYSSDNGLQWQNITPGYPYNGENSPALKLSEVSNAFQGYAYRCRISALCGEPIITPAAKLQVDPSPWIFRPPIAQKACEGSEVMFSADVIPLNGISWEYDSGSGFQSISDGGVFSGATTAFLKISQVNTAMNQWKFRLRISACGEETISEPVLLEVQALPRLLGSSLPGPVCPGTQAALSVQTEGAEVYEWQADLGQGFQNLDSISWINGKDSSILSVSPVPERSGSMLFRVKLTNACGSTEEGPFSLIVRNVPEIIQQPVSQSSCEDELIQVHIGVQGEAPRVQWEVLDTLNGTFSDLQEGEFIQGADSTTLLLHSLGGMHGMLLRCRVSGCESNLFSNPIRIVAERNYPVFIPNSFSPNGDADNPDFRIYSEGSFELSLRIYNRWGEELYASDRPDAGWDGTFQGKALSDGIYLYKLRLKRPCGTFNKTGAVYLIR